MSYILDALKKAAEQRGAAATVLLRPSAPHARRRWSRLPWIVVGFVLVLNVGALAYMLWPSGVPPVLPVVVGEGQGPGRRVSLIQPVEPPPPTHVIGAEPRRGARAADAPGSARTAERAAATAEPSRTAPTVAPPQTAAVKPAPERTTPRPAPDVRTSVAVPAVPSAARPESSSKLKLEVLSYSDNPAQRLVFINGRRYKEGDTIEGGARVEEIREDGVVLSDQGQRFTLR